MSRAAVIPAIVTASVTTATAGTRIRLKTLPIESLTRRRRSADPRCDVQAVRRVEVVAHQVGGCVNHAPADEAERPPTDHEGKHALADESHPDGCSEHDRESVVVRIPGEAANLVQRSGRCLRDELHEGDDEQCCEHLRN